MLDRDRYFADGYLVWNPNLPVSLLDDVRSDFDQFLEDPANKAAFDKQRRTHDFWQHSQACRDLAIHPNILNEIEQLYGGTRKPFCFQTLNFTIGTEQHIHADSNAFNSVPAGWMCGVWVALEDILPSSGPLIIYPGTHAWPEWTPRDAYGPGPMPDGAGSSLQRYHAYQYFVERKVKELNPPSKTLPLKKGQAIIWASNVLHGGSPIEDPTTTRASQVSHYFFSGCRYYTAVPSDAPSPIYWREASTNPPPGTGLKYLQIIQ